MVEGIVVVSAMLGFLGLIMWIRQAYGTKLDVQQRTRSEVLYRASHACSDGGEGGGGAVDGAVLPGAAQSGPGGPEASQLTTRWNVATGELRSTATGSAVFDKNAGGRSSSISYERRVLVSNVRSRSTCVCNEPKYDSSLTAWFKFGLGFVRNAGGLAGLLAVPGGP